MADDDSRRKKKRRKKRKKIVAVGLQMVKIPGRIQNGEQIQVAEEGTYSWSVHNAGGNIGGKKIPPALHFFQGGMTGSRKSEVAPSEYNNSRI